MSIVYPHLLYCASLWRGANKSQIDSLFIMQKKLLRTIYCLGRYDHTNSTFYDNGLLKINEIIKLQSCSFVYNSLFTFQSNIGFQYIQHTMNTRHDVNQLYIPRYRTNHAQQCILYRGAHLWNQCSDELRSCRNKDIFRIKFKKLLLSQYM